MQGKSQRHLSSMAEETQDGYSLFAMLSIDNVP